MSFLTYLFLERTGLQLREKQLCKYKYNMVILFKGAVFSPSLQQKGSKGFLFLLCTLMDHTLRALDMQNVASADVLSLDYVVSCRTPRAYKSLTLKRLK